MEEELCYQRDGDYDMRDSVILTSGNQVHKFGSPSLLDFTLFHQLVSCSLTLSLQTENLSLCVGLTLNNQVRPTMI
jgi:hypothetical protein